MQAVFSNQGCIFVLQNILLDMEFRTTIRNYEKNIDIKHAHKIMLIGSCFSDNIGSKLNNAMFNTVINPFGTVYNPASILNEIIRIVTCDNITENELFHANGMWNHFHFHSHFSKADKDTAISHMNDCLINAHNHLKQCDFVFITLGTSYIYELKSTGGVVSNCHKLPAKEFNKRMLTCDEVKTCLDTIVSTISEYAPQAKIIFTVSPIRHIADGLEANQLSKCTLRVATGEIIAKNHTKCDYFPAYEIMMDDLRDYRFYAADMVHPSDVAVDYIWDTFKATYFNDNTAQTVARCERIYKRLAHRPMTENIEAIERFKAETDDITSKLLNEFPYLRELPKFKTFTL